ncbi:MAG TPA: histidinol-phosphate transaminase [Steroidobacteraceae bacterium]|nr:histidinol-phosphate transaminase [Steroidobacteraceae bacterium]
MSPDGAHAAGPGPDPGPGPGAGPVDPLHPGTLAVSAVRALTPYQPGKPIGELERELGSGDIVKLASNENPHGPSPAVLQAMQRSLAQVWLYPDGGCHELKQALARHLAVDPECLSVGNGSNDLLMLLAEAFLSPETSAVYSQYAFAIYPLVVRETGACAIEVAAQAHAAPMPLGHDLPAMLAALRPDTRMLFIANPNNPTGTWALAPELQRLIEAVPPTTLVVLDEAYYEYGRECGLPESLPWVTAHPNLIVLRTFSKAYGLAGARVGYAVSHPEIAAVLDRLRPAFNVNSLAQAGAVAALADQAHMRRAVRATVAELARLRAGLSRLGLWSAPSAANFVLVRVGARAAQLFRALLERGIIVRPLTSYALPDYLRISVGLPEHTDRVLAALAALPA